MRQEEIVEKLLQVLVDAKITDKELVDILALFLYSLGQAIEKEDLKTSEEVLIKYAENPTFGSALMAQGLHMRDTWKERNNKD